MYAWHSDTIGPLTRTVEDNALFLSAIAGHDARDPLTSARRLRITSGARPRSARPAPCGRTEIARVDGIHPEVQQRFRERGRGAAIARRRDRRSIAALGEARDSAADAHVRRRLGVDVLDALRTHWDTFDVGTRTRMATALLVPAPIYSRAMRARAVVREQVLDALKTCDALISPTHLKPAGLIDDDARESREQGRRRRAPHPEAYRHAHVRRGERAGARGADGFQRRRPAAVAADRRQTFRRRDGLSRRPRLRAGDAVAYAASGSRSHARGASETGCERA